MSAMAFRFRFNALLKQRRYEHRQAQVDLAEVQLLYQEAMEEELALMEQLEKAHESWAREQARGMSAADYLVMRDYLYGLEQELLKQKVVVTERSEDVARRKWVLLECEKKVKMLETIEGTDLQDYRYEKAQLEQKELDEMAGIRKDRGTSEVE